MNIPYLADKRVKDIYLKITEGGMWDEKSGVWKKSIGKWYFNASGPFKWRMNNAGWIDIRKPSILKILGEKRFGWREYKLDRDGMLKETGFKDFMTKEEAESAFKALNEEKKMITTNKVVANALAHAVAKNAQFIKASKANVKVGSCVVREDEYLDRKYHTVREIKGDKVRVGYGDEWIKMSDLLVWTNAVAKNDAIFKQKAVAIMPVGGDWYYVNYFGNKMERKGGPFKTAEQARVAAKQDGYIVYGNSVAKNAKFNPGDFVHIKGYNTLYYIEELSSDGKYAIITDAHDNTLYEIPTKDFRLYRRAKNAKETSANAKFAVGDVVGVKITDGGKKDYVVVGIFGDKYYVSPSTFNGQVEKMPEAELIAKGKKVQVPTHTLVKNAELRIGQKVQIKGGPIAIVSEHDEGGWYAKANGRDYHLLAGTYTVVNNAKVEIIKKPDGWWVRLEDGSLRGKSDTVHGATQWAEKNGYADWTVRNATTNAREKEMLTATYKNGDKESRAIERFRELPDEKKYLLSRFRGGIRGYPVSIKDKNGNELLNAANASFKVGDQVITRFYSKSVPPGRIYEVKKVYADGRIQVADDLALEPHEVRLFGAATNAAFKVGDRVRGNGISTSYGTVKKIEGDKYIIDWDNGTCGSVAREQIKIANAAPMSAHEASVLLSGKRKAVTQYMKVEPNTLYYRALGGIFAVPESDTMRTAIEAIGSRVLPYKVGGVVGNSMSAESGKNRIYKTPAGTFVLIGKSGAPMGEYATKELAEKAAKTMGWGDVPVVNGNAVTMNDEIKVGDTVEVFGTTTRNLNGRKFIVKSVRPFAVTVEDDGEEMSVMRRNVRKATNAVTNAMTIERSAPSGTKVKIRRINDAWGESYTIEKAEGSEVLVDSVKTLRQAFDYAKSKGWGVVSSPNGTMSFNSSVANADKFSSKYAVGHKGYWMTQGRPYEQNGRKIVFTIKEVRDEKDDAIGKKETTYWCTAPGMGGIPVEESKFKPL